MEEGGMSTLGRMFLCTNGLTIIMFVLLSFLQFIADDTRQYFEKPTWIGGTVDAMGSITWLDGSATTNYAPWAGSPGTEPGCLALQGSKETAGGEEGRELGMEWVIRP